MAFACRPAARRYQPQTAAWMHQPVVVAGLKVTRAARTLLDIGSVTRPWYVEFALEDALCKQLVDIGELWTILETEGGRGCPGSRIFRQLLEQRPVDYEALHSVLEIHLERLINDSPYARTVDSIRL